MKESAKFIMFRLTSVIKVPSSIVTTSDAVVTHEFVSDATGNCISPALLSLDSKQTRRAVAIETFTFFIFFLQGQSEMQNKVG